MLSICYFLEKNFAMLFAVIRSKQSSPAFAPARFRAFFQGASLLLRFESA